MTYKDIIKHYGNVDTAAHILGYSRMSLYNWRDNGIPDRTQQLIEAITDGKLTASKTKKGKK